MNKTEFLSSIKTLLVGFTFDDSSTIGCIHGAKQVPIRAFRDSGDKSIIHILGSRSIFISGQMYPNTDRDFIYCTIYTLSRRRGYRCKNWGGYEYKKLFVSGKTYELLFKELDKVKVQILD